MNPDSQVLKVLQEAELQPLTLPLEDATICEEESSLCPQRENISGWWCKILNEYFYLLLMISSKSHDEIKVKLFKVVCQ